MEKNHIGLQDESGDKKYFTIIPNFILNHSTGVAQALYLQLKRIAGEGGTVACGSKYLCKQLGITHNTLKKEFTYLLEKRWIEFVGYKEYETNGGVQKVKAYKIIDLWDLNNKEYQNSNTLNTKGYQNKHKGVSNEQRRGIKITTKEEPLITNNIAETSSAEWDLESRLEDMEKDPESKENVIATFIREKGVKIENSKQLSAVIARYARVAKQLAGAYTNEQIFKAYDQVKKDNENRRRKGEALIDYTLETIYKRLTK